MAIVMSGTASTGAKWRIHDDAYINNTPEQNEALRRRACEVAYNALVQHIKAHGGVDNAENRRNDSDRQR